jgi:5'-deoxynucleotidase YfbR-like HD superfamily hydrolase
MALVLANFLLPLKLAEYSSYHRNDVIRKLMFHDIAESYTGDPVYPKLGDKKDDAMKNELNALKYIRYKDTYEDIYNTQEFFTDIRDFMAAEEGKFEDNSKEPSINAQFARDIDKLENLIQLYLYREKYDDYRKNIEDFDKFKENLLDLNTQYVKNLALSFIKWADENIQKYNFWDWKSPFFEKELILRTDRVR